MGAGRASVLTEKTKHPPRHQEDDKDAQAQDVGAAPRVARPLEVWFILERFAWNMYRNLNKIEGKKQLNNATFLRFATTSSNLWNKYL